MVVVLEPTEYSTDKAQKFGAVKLMFRHRQDRAHSLSPNFQTEVLARLEKMGFRPSEDFLCVCGHMMSMILMVGHVTAHYGYCKLLCYNSSKEIHDFQVVEVGKPTSSGDSDATDCEGHQRGVTQNAPGDLHGADSLEESAHATP